MQLTTAQKTALKGHVNANTATVITPQGSVQIKDVPQTPDTYDEVTAWYNQLFDTTYFVLRSSLPLHELVETPGVGDDGVTPTVFTIGGSTGGYIARSDGERDAFIHIIFNSVLLCRPSLANIRTAWDDIFSGAGAGAVGNRAHWRAKIRRQITRFEHVLKVQTVGGPTQTGNRGTATNPDTLGTGADGALLDGPISKADLLNAVLTG